ncbi:MAG: hypothetical protein PHY93_07250 [Bacteriovorax sp.]|nr:hypothetical protein [Bacteriovorax sp.]
MKNFVKLIGHICLLGSFLISTAVFGANANIPKEKRVTLLISVSGLSQEKFQETADAIAKKFYDRFSNDFDTRIIFQAEQVDLFSALNDENNIGVFWVSHSNSGQGAAGTNLDGRIVDSHGIDISSIFTKIHPNLKWLGIIACKAFPIFEKKAKENVYNDRDLLLYDTSLRFSSLLNRDKLEDNAFSGMIIAANSSLVAATFEADRNFSKAATYLSRFKNQEESSLDRQNGSEFNLKISRSPEPGNDAEMDAVQVLLKGKVLYVFSASNQKEEAEITVPWDFNHQGDDISFVVDSGLSSNSKNSHHPHLGRFHFSSEDLKIQWNVLTFNGKPLGVNQNVYQSKKLFRRK